MQQKKTRTRASHPKVRTGCHTCKARRVKCDEQRPNCQKCLNTGRKCEGYKNIREWVVVVAPPAPISDGFEDDRSRRHFDYFRTQAVYELSWFFQDGDWGSLVLKESHTSLAVRHAVIALACSHEDFRDNLTVASQAPQYAYAAKHYSKAIKNLIKETPQDAQETRMRALICGLLFISIELLRGNNIAALHHLDGCLKIVKEAQKRMGPFIPGQQQQTYSGDPEAYLGEDIIPMYARLDVQASMLLGRAPHHSGLIPYSWDPLADIQIEETPMNCFASLLDACNALLIVANHMNNFSRICSTTYQHQRPIPVEILAHKSIILDRLRQWDDALQPLLNSNLDRHSHDKAKLMQLHQRTGLTLVENCLNTSECIMDDYRWTFEDIVNFTTELKAANCPTTAADDDNSSSSSSDSDSHWTSPHPRTITKTGFLKYRSRPFFLLDNGVIFSLYWTALKCRDGFLRRRAISLLESSTQEGVWIGPVQAAIAKRVVEIEEERAWEAWPAFEDQKGAYEIPECVRVCSVGTDIDKVARRARVVLLRKRGGDEGGMEESVEWVSW